MKKIPLACILEDDPIHLFLTKRHIELSGLVDEILVCKNGKDAYDTLHTLFLSQKLLPQIIFLDLNMPIWDGWLFLEEFLKLPIPGKVNIYILSSSNNEDDYKKAEQFNLKDKYLIKPIDGKQLHKILSELE